MIDINILREHPEKIKENLKKKFQEDKISLIDVILRHDKKWRELKQEADNLRHERNTLTSEITRLKKAKKDVTTLIKKAQNIPKQIKEIEDKANRTKTKVTEAMLSIPNIIHESVPIGKDDKDNVVQQTIGKPVKKDFKLLSHSELAEKLDIADFETARETSGKGFYYLKGDLALLNRALINYARDFMVKENFTYVEPPLMIRSQVVDGVMSFEEKDDMMYKIEGEDLYLIGTSEHPLIGLFINKKIKEENLPIKITGFSPCFRKEIGAHGIDEKGLFRVHQFDKQEMIVICKPEDSYKWYEKMQNYTIELFKSLELPIREIECCSGDLPALKAKSSDIEVWSPRQEKYFEVTSVTNMEEAQARRLNIKVVNKKGEKYFAHTLNNTVIATSRAMVAILENHQNKDGSINIPKALQSYMGKKQIK